MLRSGDHFPVSRRRRFPAPQRIDDLLRVIAQSGLVQIGRGRLVPEADNGRGVAPAEIVAQDHATSLHVLFLKLLRQRIHGPEAHVQSRKKRRGLIVVLLVRRPPRSTLFPYTTRLRSRRGGRGGGG